MRFSRFLGALLPLTAPFAVPIAHAQTTTIPAAAPTWNLDFNRAAQPLYVRGDSAFIVGRASGANAALPRLELWNHRNEKLADLVSSTNADGTVNWKLPSERNGYFEVRPAAGSVSWPALGSRPANKLTFAVVDEIKPNPSRDYKTHFLSIQGSSPAGNLNVPPTPNVHAYMGLQARALDYSWYKLQPKSDDFSTFETFFANDKAAQGARQSQTWPYFYLSKNPTWAVDPARISENARKNVSNSHLPPRDLKQYEAYLERVVPHIAKSYDFLPYRVYEVMWEPVIPWGWQGTNAEIVAMFEVAHRVVHRFDPNGRVSGPTLSSFGDTPQYEELLKLGLGKYIDVSGWHMYAGYPTEKANIPAALGRIRALNRKYIGRDLPLVGTEFGLAEGKAGNVENQAYGMTAATLMFKAEGIAQHTLFYLTDFISEPGYGLFYTAVAGLPYAPEKIAPKPAIPMLRAAIDQIGSARAVGKLDYPGEDVWAYVFVDEATREHLVALWDASGNDRTVELDTGAARVQVVDSFGNRETRSTNNEKVALPLRRSPLYVRGVSAELFATQPTDKTQTWRVFRGQKLTQNLRLKGSSTKGATVFLSAPAAIAAPIAPAKVTGNVAPIALQIAPDAPIGIVAASVRVRGADGTISRALQRVEVVPEVQIDAAQMQNVARKISLRSRVKNVSPARWNGQVALTLQGQKQTRALALAPQQETWVEFSIAAPTDVTQKVPATLELRSSTGSQLSHVTPLSFFGVQRASTKDVWREMRLLPLRATGKTIFRTFNDAKFEGDKDLSARAGYSYDSQNLYVQYLVEDEVHRSNVTPTQMWKHDSVQLAFDVAPGRETNSNGLAENFERTNSEWGFAFTSRGPEVYVWKPPGGSSLAANSLVANAGIGFEGGRAGTTTTYRITLPWKTIDPRGLHRNAIGISAAINDSDTESLHLDRRALLLFGGILGDKDAANFGRANLE